MSSRLQNIIVVFGLVLIATLGYYLYTQNDSFRLTESGQAIGSQAGAESAEFLNKLNELKQISLDDSLFRDPRWQSLIDNRKPVQPESVGRNNPFQEIN